MGQTQDTQYFFCPQPSHKSCRDIEFTDNNFSTSITVQHIRIALRSETHPRKKIIQLIPRHVFGVGPTAAVVLEKIKHISSMMKHSATTTPSVTSLSNLNLKSKVLLNYQAKMGQPSITIKASLWLRRSPLKDCPKTRTLTCGLGDTARVTAITVQAQVSGGIPYPFIILLWLTPDEFHP